MEAVNFSVKVYQITQCHIPENIILKKQFSKSQALNTS
jgi:hypothetical protein